MSQRSLPSDAPVNPRPLACGRRNGRSPVRGAWWLVFLGLFLPPEATAANANPKEASEGSRVPGAAEQPRDTVVLSGGEELRGRVIRPYGEDSVEMRVAGRTRRIDPKDIVDRSTVNDRLAAWLDVRHQGLSVARQWQLVEHAVAADLPAMARLQAYYVLLLDPNHEAAHELLDHRGSSDNWRWRFEGKLVRTDRFTELATDSTSPLTLDSEHWRLTCDAGLATTIDSLFELERLYVEFFSEFGPHLDPTEQLDPMEFRVYADPSQMPVHSTVLRHPSYDPGELLSSTLGTSSHSVTFMELGVRRPHRLLDLGTQQLIYEAVLGFSLSDAPTDTSRFRVCASLEIGFGHWMSTTFVGPFGYARRVAAVLNPEVRQAAALAIEARVDSVDPLGRLALREYARYQIDPRSNSLVWASARGFVSWLMDPATTLPSTGQPGHTAVICLLQALYRDATGNSSSRWDQCLGNRLEDLAGTYTQWL